MSELICAVCVKYAHDCGWNESVLVWIINMVVSNTFLTMERVFWEKPILCHTVFISNSKNMEKSMKNRVLSSNFWQKQEGKHVKKKQMISDQKTKNLFSKKKKLDQLPIIDFNFLS